MRSDPAPPARVSSVELAAAAGLGLLVVAIVALRTAHPPCELGLWGDRDLVRAATWLGDGRTTGAELSYGTGACVPGGAGNALVAALQALGDRPTAVQRGLYALDAVGLLLVAGLAARAAGPLAAAATALAWLGVAATDATLTQLWNPAYQPLFLAVSVVGLARFAGGGSARWLALWGAGVAVAAHMHLSAGVWGAAGLLVLLLDGRAGLVRGLGWALLGLVVPYLPHLADEAAHGFPNTRALLDQPHVHALDVPERNWRVEDLGVVLGFVGGHAPASRLPAWTAAAGPLGLVLAALGLADAVRRARGGDGRARGAAVAVGATALTLGWLAVDPFIHTQPRYFQVVVPGLALGAGLGVRALGGLARPLGLVAALALAAPASWWIDRTVWAPQPGADVDEAAYEAVQAATGWSWEDVAGRVIAPVAGARSTWTAMGPVDDLLRRHGARFDGSRPPPCAALFVETPEDEARRVLPGLVETGPGGFRWLGWTPVLDRRGLALYDPGTPLCPTGMIQRYVDRPWEAVARAASADLPAGAVRPVDGPDGRGVLVVSQPDGLPRLVAVVRLAPGPDGLAVTLESAQLRGEALNLGWFESALVERPRLVLTAADGAVTEAVLVEGRLGFRAAATPVRATVAVPGPGPHRVDLVWERVVDPLVPETPWPMGERATVTERFGMPGEG